MSLQINLPFTVVFQKNWQALAARNTDGSRKYKYIINKGSSRSSKTYSLIDLFDIYARQNSNERLTVWRETKTLCKKTVLSDMIKHHRKTGRYKLGYEFNKTDSIFHYEHNNGGQTTVEIHGTDDEEIVHGFTQNIAWINEPYKISKETFDQIDMRSDVVFLDYNPKKDFFVNDLLDREDCIVIESTFKDNPFCPEQQRNKILSFQPIAYAELVQNGSENDKYIQGFKDKEQLRIYLIEKYGENKHVSELLRCWQNEKQYSASEYNWLVYGLGQRSENPNKIYHGWIKIPNSRFDEIKKQKNLQSYYGLDFGFAAPSACVEIMYDGDRAFYVRQKLYQPINTMKGSLGDNLIAAGVPTGNKTFIICDPQDNLIGVSSNMVADLRQFHDLNAFKGVKPGYIDRFDFMNKVLILYTEDSTDLENEYDEYEYEVINGMRTEKPVKKNDHIINALEYVVWFAKIRHGIRF